MALIKIFCRNLHVIFLFALPRDVTIFYLDSNYGLTMSTKAQNILRLNCSVSMQTGIHLDATSRAKYNQEESLLQIMLTAITILDSDD